jgi:hypothetical protein
MKPADVAIWERFIRNNPSAYHFCQYDVPVGDGPEFDTLVSEETGGHQEMLYKKKIDVVAMKGENIDIIELKPNAGSSAVGQVKNYKRLYIRDYSPTVQLRCIIITDAASKDTLAFAGEEGVEVIIV